MGKVEYMDVVCIGRAVADVFLSNVPRFPTNEELLRAKDGKVFSGGDALNVAANLSRLGHRVGFIGLLGHDCFGDFLKRELSGAEVDISRLIQREDVSTAFSIVMDYGQGQHGFIYAPGASDMLSLNDIDIEYVAAAPFCYLGDTFAMERMDAGDSVELLRALRNRGSRVILDCDPDEKGRGMRLMKPLLENTEAFIPSMAEAKELTGVSDPVAAIDRFIKAGVSVAGVKLGAKGALLGGCGIRTVHIPACRPEHLVDTTGAGDAFMAGFIHGMVEGWDIADCGHFASACGSLTCEVRGATSSALSIAAITQRMSRQFSRQAVSLGEYAGR